MSLTSKRALRLAAACAVLNGVALAHFLLKIEKETSRTVDKSLMLASIVQRNVEHLDDFEIIALTEMGLLKVVER